MNKYLFLLAFILLAFFITIHGLTVAYQCDFNGDGFVDTNDIAIFAGDFGKTSGYDPQCDIDGDYDIDGFDLSIFAERLQYHSRHCTSDTDCRTGTRCFENQCLPDMTQHIGPYRLDGSPERPVIVFYVVSKRPDTVAELVVERISPTHSAHFGPHRALVRLFDPEENVMAWHFQEQFEDEDKPTIVESPVEPPVTGPFVLKKTGVYQFRITTCALSKCHH